MHTGCAVLVTTTSQKNPERPSPKFQYKVNANMIFLVVRIVKIE